MEIEKIGRQMKSLLEVPSNRHVKIVSIIGGKGARQILAQLGVGVGSTVMIRRNAPFAGPLLIENHGTSIAVGRGVAAKILVEEV
ncbi:MAG: FeoA family protein [Calditrichia bacterium]